jgi:hypothetical protein
MSTAHDPLDPLGTILKHAHYNFEVIALGSMHENRKVISWRTRELMRKMAIEWALGQCAKRGFDYSRPAVEKAYDVLYDEGPRPKLDDVTTTIRAYLDYCAPDSVWPGVLPVQERGFKLFAQCMAADIDVPEER